jgi:superfamily II DNA or RNA helicase
VNLYPDQDQLVASVGQALRKHQRVCVQAPTGSGKTVVASWIVDKFLSVGRQPLILVPRRELAYQFQGALEGFGRYFSLIMAGEEPSLGIDGNIATFDTLHARAVQRDLIRLPPADVIIVDEAHLALARTRKDIIEAYPDAMHIGLTATPARSDGKGLSKLYDDLVLGPSIRSLIDAGRLVEPRYFTGPRPELGEVPIRAGDYVIRDLAKVTDTKVLVGGIVQNWLLHAEGRSTVVFCTTRKHARHVADEFERAGVSTDYLDGKTPHLERKSIIERVRSGATTVLVNVAVATYGIDIPELSCAVMARPTKSLVLYFQTIGRVLRTAPGKSDCLILDHSGCVAEHGMIDSPVAWSLDGNMKEATERERGERKEPKPIECPACKSVFKATHICPNCGHVLAGGREAVPYHDVELSEGKPKTYTMDEKREWYAQLVLYGRRKNYREGWAAHKYKEKFGVWPRLGELPPARDISQKVRNWIMSRAIAHARRKDENSRTAL